MRIWEKFKAWRRNETMLPGVNRGRCFKKNEPSGNIEMTAKPEIELTIKVTRADGSTEVYNG